MNPHSAMPIPRIINKIDSPEAKSPPGKNRPNRLRILLLFLIAAYLSGCAIIPIITTEQGLRSGRGQILESDLAAFEIGKTTREEVLFKFGEPSLVLNDQKLIVYRWAVSKGGAIFVAVAPGAGMAATAGPIDRYYLVRIEFNENGRLLRFDRSSSIWSEMDKKINEWIPSEDKKYTRTMRILISPAPTLSALQQDADAPCLGVKIRVEDFADLRPDLEAGSPIGKVKPAWLKEGVDVCTRQQPSEVVRDSVMTQLQAMGAEITDQGPEVVVSGAVRTFAIKTTNNRPGWYNLFGSVEFDLTARHVTAADAGVTRHYKIACRRHSMSPFSEEKFTAVLGDCMKDYQRQTDLDIDLIWEINSGFVPGAGGESP